MSEHYEALRVSLTDIIEKNWGPRCEVKDLDDGVSEEARCPVCLMYERFEKFWEMFVNESS